MKKLFKSLFIIILLFMVVSCGEKDYSILVSESYENTISIVEGSNHEIVYALPNGGTPIFKSSNEKIATVSNGVILAIQQGNCDIEITLEEDTSICKVIHLVIEDKIYVVHYDGNGGTLVTGQLTQYVSELKELSEPTFKREGYILKKYNELVDEKTGEITMQAEWEDNSKYEYTVSFVNGETINKVTVKGNSEVNEPETVSKTGYEFEGWFCEGVKWNFSNKVNSDIQLIATYKPNVYTITIRYNDYIRDDFVMKFNYGDVVKVEEPSRTGYTFNGWTLGVVPETMPAENITIKANWTINQYTLTIKFNDNITEDLVITQAFNTDIPEIKIPNHEGMVFERWSEELPIAMPYENKVIEAYWTVGKYQMIFKYNDGVTSDLVLSLNYGSAIQVENPTRVGYEFKGWGEEVPATMPAENKTYTAVWSANKHELVLKYNNDIGEIHMDYFYGDKILIDEPDGKVGYTFDGWDVEVPATMPDKDVILEAKWKINQYTLIINLNNGEDNLVLTQDYGTPIQVTTPVKKGFSFREYVGGLPETMPAENRIIKVAWSVNQYTITISYKDGKTPDKEITQEYSSYIAPISDPTCEGYSFKEWSEPIPVTMPAENKTIEAIWVPGIYSLTLDYADGTTSNKVVTQEVDSVIETIQNPVRLGYTFVSWSEPIPETMPNHDQTITAIWQSQVQYTKTSNGIIITGMNVSDNITILDKYEDLPVIEIGENAFMNLNMSALQIPSTVTKIGNNAFKDAKIATLDLPKALTTIGSHAFDNCDNLISIDLSYVLSINEYAFANCDGLTQVKCPLELDNFYANIFDGSNNIAYQTYENGRYLSNELNNYAMFVSFIDKTQTSLRIYENTEFIGSNPFEGCSAIQSIEIPFIGNKLGDNQFLGFIFGGSTYQDNETCIPASLENVTITKQLDFSENTFATCKTIKHIVFADGIKSVGINAFANCDALIYNESNEIAYLASQNNPYAVLVGPTSLNETAYTINDNTRIITARAFANCEQVIALVVPDSVIYIGNECFNGCDALTNLTIPFVGESYLGKENKTFKFIDNDANMAIKNVTVTKEVELAAEAFGNCSSIESITFTDTLKIIGNFAFTDCSALSSVHVEESLEKVGSNIFKNCSSLVLNMNTYVRYLSSDTSPCYILIKLDEQGYYFDFICPSDTKIIADDAFKGGRLVRSITLNDSLIYIGRYAFNCSFTNTSINVPDTVQYIGYCAFLKGTFSNISLPFLGYSSTEPAKFIDIVGNISTSFNKVTIRGGSELVDYAFSNKTFGTIELADSITKIGAYCFNQSHVTNITLPSALTHIGEKAFYYCYITYYSNDLPNTITYFGDYAFCHAGELNKVEFSSTITEIPVCCFQDTTISNLIMGDNITIINDYAFYNSKIYQMTFPKNIQKIGKRAFSFNYDLDTLDLSNVEEIGENAFTYYHINELSLSDKLVKMGENPFTNSEIKKLTISNFGRSKEETTKTSLINIYGSLLEEVTVTNEENVYDDSFKNLSAMTTVHFTKTIKSIGKNAFYNCSKLSNFDATIQVNKIDSYAFYNCIALTSLALNNEIQMIEEGAFKSCGTLHITKFPTNLIYIGAYAFEDCSYLKVIGAEKVEYIGEGAFMNSGIVSFKAPETLTEINAKVFKDCSLLYIVDLPSSLRSIGEEAFKDCAKLFSINISPNLESIAASSIEGCTSFKYNEVDGIQYLGNEDNKRILLIAPVNKNITSIVISEDTKKIAKGAFKDCTQLASITFNSTIDYLGDNLFYNCTSLTTISIPNSVKEIGSNLLTGCTNLEKLDIPFVGNKLYVPDYSNFGYLFGETDPTKQGSVIPESLKTVTVTNAYEILDNAFANVQNVQTIKLKSSLQKIGNSVFENCSDLRSLDIQETKEIGSNLLRNCNQLAILSIPYLGSSLTDTTNDFLGYFYGASSYLENTNVLPQSLQTILVNDDDRVSDNAFYYCKFLQHIELSDSVATIGKSAFSKCISLVYLVLPSQVQTIEESTFHLCASLKTITISKNVTKIDKDAFYYCKICRDFTYLGTKSDWNEITKEEGWNSQMSSITVHCLDGTVVIQ